MWAITGAQEPAAGGVNQFRAGYAEREQAIEALKTAFIQGRLTGEELDTRTGRALTAQTYAELDAVAADIPGAPQLNTRPASPPPDRRAAPGSPVATRRWPLAKATVKSGGFVVIATAIAYSGNLIDNSTPNGHGAGAHHGWTRLLLLLTLTLMVTALVILGRGVAASLEQRRPRNHLPPLPRSGEKGLEAAAN